MNPAKVPNKKPLKISQKSIGTLRKLMNEVLSEDDFNSKTYNSTFKLVAKQTPPQNKELFLIDEDGKKYVGFYHNDHTFDMATPSKVYKSIPADTIKFWAI